VGIFIGTIGFFFVLFLLYARTFPVIAQAEVKTILKSSGEFYKKRSEQGIPTKPAIIVTDSAAINGRSDNNLNG
jgi:molybdopterin-containing oxidoreductase family membrane subunit